jgi:transposase
MLSFASGMKIFVYTRATDMRKGFNGLSGIVRSEFQADPADGSLFLFINRRRDRMKLLHFDGGGYWLYYRLLEAGTFEELKANDGSCRLQIDATQLSMLLAGVSLLRSDRRRKRFSNPRAEQAA